MQGKNILISDHSVSGEGYDLTLLWDDRSVRGAGQISVPEQSEINLAKIRTKIAQWRDGILEKDRLARDLEFAPGLSAIWFSQLCELSPYKSDLPYFLVRLFQLEDELSKIEVKSIHYEGSDERLHEILKSWCPNFSSQLTARPKSSGGLARKLPHAIQALLFLAYRFKTRIRWNWKAPHVELPKTEDLFVVYYPNFDKLAFEQGVFKSKYLPGLENIHTRSKSWCWVYAEPKNDKFREAVQDRTRFNEHQKEVVTLVEDQITPNVLLKTLVAFLKVSLRNFFSRNYDLKTQGLGWDLSGAVKSQLLSTSKGLSLMEGLYYYFAFENLFNQQNYSRIYFLYEGQPWERALLLANKNSKTIGIQHTVVRPADLRYFFDSKAESFKNPNPDKLLVNGKFPLELLKDLNLEVRAVEALRFDHLMDRSKANFLENGATTLFLEAEPQAAEDLLRLVLASIGPKEELLVRPHPFLRLPETFGERVKFDRSSSISDLLKLAGRVIVSNGTSVAIEALSKGINPLVYLPKKQLNLFPLPSGASFFWDSQSLSKLLRSPATKAELPVDFFVLDPSFTRWRQEFEEIDR